MVLNPKEPLPGAGRPGLASPWAWGAGQWAALWGEGRGVQEEDTFLVVICELSWVNLDMKTVKLKSIPRNPKEMRQVAVETGCGQHLADIW